jgi:hypothetical protein
LALSGGAMLIAFAVGGYDKAELSVALMVETIFGSAQDHVVVQRLEDNTMMSATGCWSLPRGLDFIIIRASFP